MLALTGGVVASAVEASTTADSSVDSASTVFEAETCAGAASVLLVKKFFPKKKTRSKPRTATMHFSVLFITLFLYSKKYYKNYFMELDHIHPLKMDYTGGYARFQA
jgi:hypothetical protein